MKYAVVGVGSDLTITVKAVGANQAHLMKELNQCAQGRCSCPTTQYAKVESMQDGSRRSGSHHAESEAWRLHRSRRHQ